MYCECGCGELTKLMVRTKGDYRKGDYRKFVSGHNTRTYSNEEQSRRANFNDGSKLRGTGEGKKYRKLHQRHEHRVVAELKIGRSLVKGEIVHHKDGNKFNNHPDNLEVVTRYEHIRLHLDEMHDAFRNTLKEKNRGIAI